ncbi:hypothetical protein Slin14017_G094910 [Septoria linicola]|nr:hypothetical protein Slin14017_G094910 [Septoria linicola]
MTQHDYRARREQDLLAKLSKVTPSIANSVNTLVFAGAPWKWLHWYTDVPPGTQISVDDLDDNIAFPCLSTLTKHCNEVFPNVRHIRFHLDFLCDDRFWDAKWEDIKATAAFSRLETTIVRIHFDHDWIPPFEERNLLKDWKTIQWKLGGPPGGSGWDEPPVDDSVKKSVKKSWLMVELLYKTPPPDMNREEVAKVCEGFRPLI